MVDAAQERQALLRRAMKLPHMFHPFSDEDRTQESGMVTGPVGEVISIQGANIDLGGSFRDHARQTVLRTANKYFGRLSAASVHLSREGLFFRCTVNIQMGALKTMSAEFQHRDCYFAFRNALERVEKQLRRAKRALREDKASRVDKDMVLQEGLRAHTSM